MRLTFTLLVTLLLLPALAAAQGTSLKGRFVDPSTNAPVPQVAVKLTSFADTSDVKRVTGQDDGTFEILGLGVHSYRLEATRVGYAPLKQVIRVSQANHSFISGRKMRCVGSAGPIRWRRLSNRPNT